MAFAVLCLSRLVHGYNCKSKSPVLFKKQFFNNKYMQGALAVGVVLVTLVLTVPAFQGLFAVRTLNLTQLFTVYGFSSGAQKLLQELIALDFNDPQPFTVRGGDLMQLDPMVTSTFQLHSQRKSFYISFYIIFLYFLFI